MPIQQITENTKQFVENSNTIHDLIEWSQFIFPIAGVIIAVFAWAWKRMQRSVDKLEEAVTTHALRNEETFDQLFTSQRLSDEKLHQLLGEHSAIHKGGNLHG